MSDMQETITDIIAEKRRRADEIERDCSEKMARGKMVSDCYARELVADMRKEADRLEAAWKRERAKITPKPDPSWKDICAKCMDGDIEPKHCEYYGEPNGCNSPIYGEHPTAKKSLVVGDAVKLREALKVANETADELLKWTWNHYQELNCMGGRLKRAIEGVLAAPARNCDRFADETDAQIAFLNEVWLISVTKETALERDRFENWTDEMRGRYAKWLFATATEQEGGNDGR